MPGNTLSSMYWNGAIYDSQPSKANTSFIQLILCLPRPGGPPPTPDCAFLGVLYGVFVPEDQRHFNGSYMLFSPKFDPTKATGTDFYRRFMAEIPRWNEKYDISVYLHGYGADTYDIVKFCNENLPIVAAIISVILFVLVTVAFGCLGVPVRCVVTVALNCIVVFGCVNIVYVEKAFNFMGLSGFTGNGAVAWQVPFAAFLIIVGVSLNYALISVIRALEFYWLGVPTAQAIRFGVADSGREITVAALMMFIVFFGLFFSQVPAMNQLGMYLLLTAVFSGMIFRLFLTPPAMALLGDLNWFPMNSCNSFSWKFTPFVLPSGAAKSRGSFANEEFYEDRREGEHPTASNGPVYRSSRPPPPGVSTDSM